MKFFEPKSPQGAVALSAPPHDGAPILLTYLFQEENYKKYKRAILQNSVRCSAHKKCQTQKIVQAAGLRADVYHV